MSSWQLWTIVFISSFCVTPFSFVTLHRELGGHVWVLPLLQACVGTLAAAGVVLLARAAPGASLVEVARRAFGPLASVFLLGVTVYVALWAPVGNLTLLLRIVQSTTLPYTSTWMTGAALTACSFYAAALGYVVFSRTTEVLAFILLPGIVVLATIAYLGPLHLGYLSQSPATVPISGADFGYALGARGFSLALAFLGLWPRAAGRPWVLYSATLSSVLLIGMLFVLPHLLFAQPSFALLEFPPLNALSTVNATYIGISSFWPLTLIIWYGVSWVVVAGSLAGAAHILHLWLGVPRHLAAAVLAVITLVLSQWTKSVTLQEDMVMFWTVWGYLAVVVGPWTAWLLLRLRETPAGRVHKVA